MAQNFMKLEKPLFDFQSRQVVVFEEVLENFEEKCCDKHEPQRQKIAQKARSAFKILQFCYEAKESREHQELLNFARMLGVDFQKVAAYKNNINYHTFSLILAKWCMKLSQIQECFQSMHGHELLPMKMPPGCHEVSQNQLKMHFQKALMSYMVLSTSGHRLPKLTPIFVFFMAQIVSRCRTHPNPAVYHMVSLFIEHIVRDANNQMLQQ